MTTREDLDDNDLPSLDAFDETKLTAADRLTRVSEHIVKLRRISRNLDTASTEEVLVVLKFAVQVDRKLVDWYEARPAAWQIISAQEEPPHTTTTLQAWSSRLDVYDDMGIGVVLNNYRTHRITVQVIIMRCLERARSPLGLGAWTMPEQTIEDLMDDICACVPWHLGDRHCREQSPESIYYPHAPGKETTLSHRYRAYQSGPWLLVR